MAKVQDSGLTDALSPQLTMDTGVKLKRRDVSKTAKQAADENISRMSKADDLGDSQRKLSERDPISEKFIPTERFVHELKQALEGLSEGERSFLQHHGIVVKAVRRMTDISGASAKMGGCFVASEKAVLYT